MFADASLSPFVFGLAYVLIVWTFWLLILLVPALSIGMFAAGRSCSARWPSSSGVLRTVGRPGRRASWTTPPSAR